MSGHGALRPSGELCRIIRHLGTEIYGTLAALASFGFLRRKLYRRCAYKFAIPVFETQEIFPSQGEAKRIQLEAPLRMILERAIRVHRHRQICGSEAEIASLTQAYSRRDCTKARCRRRRLTWAAPVP